MHWSLPSLALTLSLLGAGSASADTLAVGLEHGQVLPAPGGLDSAFAPLPGGQWLVASRTEVLRVAQDGAILASLFTFPMPVWPSFVLVDPAATTAYIGESSQSRIWRLDLVQGSASIVTELFFNYDAAFEDAGHLLVSAAPGGFGTGTSVVRVDLASGARTTVALLPGYSGPLTTLPDGSLVLAVIDPLAFPPTTDLVSWTAAQLQAGVMLDRASAQTLIAGLPGATDLVFDARSGMLLLSASDFNTTQRTLLEVDPVNAVTRTLVDSTQWLGRIALVEEPGSTGSLQPFQPPGSRLFYSATEYPFEYAQLRELRPRRPTLSIVSVMGPGHVSLTAEGLEPGGSAWFLVAVGQGTQEQSYGTALGFPFHAVAPPSGMRRFGFPAQAGPDGRATVTYFDPGHLAGTLVFQALIRDPQGTPRGTSEPLPN